MINEVRTCLGNLDGPADLTLPGAEYIPSAFRARRLPGYLRRLHTTLFGVAPDALMRNYRLAQIMPILAGSSVSELLTTDDASISAVFSDELIFGEIFPSDETLKVEEGNAEDLAFSEQTVAALPDSDGVCFQRWAIRNNSGAVTVQTLEGGAGTFDYATTDEGNGFTVPTALPGSTKLLQVRSAAESSWVVSLARRPRKNILQIFSEMESRLSLEISLLWVADSNGDMTRSNRLRTLYESASDPVERFCAVAFALSFRIRELPVREGQNG